MQERIQLDSYTARDDPDARQIVARLVAERAARPARETSLPGWVRPAMRVLPRVLAIATIANGVIGLIAILAPLLRAWLGERATAPVYTTYSLICPQRPSHTTFIAGEPMAMEQRMVAMYVAFGVAGALYCWWRQLGRPLPHWIALAGMAPALIDVALSTANIHASTADSRWTTGALASLAVVWWAFPRFDAMLDIARSRLNTVVRR